MSTRVQADVLERGPASDMPGRLSLWKSRPSMVTLAWEGLLAPFWALVVGVAVHWHDQLFHWKIPLEGCRFSDEYMRTD